MIISQGGTVTGKGFITRANGDKEEFTLTSKPLTKEQAEQLEKQNGDNPSNKR